MSNPNTDRILVTEEDLTKARELLGKVGKDMSDNELIDQIIAIKALTSGWLDEYEKSIFDGKTLDEKLSE